MFSQTKLTYHRRLFLGLLAYYCVIVGCFVVFQYHREKQFKMEELNGRLQVLNAQIIAQLDSTGQVVLPQSGMADVQLSVWDRAGTLIFTTSADTPAETALGNRKEIAEARQNGEGYALRQHRLSTGNSGLQAEERAPAGKQSYLFAAKSGQRYLVRTAVPFTVKPHELLAADYVFLWFMTGVTLVMCFIAYFSTRRIGKHIERLNTFAEKVEQGERIVDTEPFPNDELGSISNHIVYLYAKLQQAISERDNEHRKTLHEQQEKNRIKRQLTNNINHELKTPVASMQVCLETLISNKNLPADKHDDFLNRCYEANKRLQSLLADVSVLTRIEDGANNISKQPLNITAIIAETCRDFEAMAAKKGITIVNNVAQPISIDGNTSLVSSIFRNLMDNAIAYSEGNTIEIGCQAGSDQKYTFTFADNGRGIAEEHLTKIFERFYRIDTGRSRQLGGTGLGLSIVKNAVQWHGGTISAKNRPHGGLLFVFTLQPNLTPVKHF